jgi:hypothetical protein
LGYATLPLGSHLLQSQSAAATDCDAVATSSVAVALWGGGGRKMIANAQSYRDVREGLMTLATNGSSRDNTLSRETHMSVSSFPSA